MIRALSWIAVAALAVSHTDAVYEVTLTCLGTTWSVEFPIRSHRAPSLSVLQQVEGPNSALVLRGLNLGTDIYVEDCNNVGGGKTMVMNVSDPSTWLVVMPGKGTCFYTLDDDDQSALGCNPVNGSLVISHISEHCGNVATAKICNPLDTSASSPSVTVSVVVAVGVLIANLVCA